MDVKSRTVPSIMLGAGLERDRAKRWIEAGHFQPLTSVGSRRGLRWTFNDAVRLELLTRLVASGLPPKVGRAIGVLPLGQGLMFALLVCDDGSYRGKPCDPEDVPDLLDDFPSARTAILANIDDCAAVVAIIDEAARDEAEAA